MKLSEFRKLIREEVSKVLNEGTPKFKVGQLVDDLTDDDLYRVVKVYPNKAAAMIDMKKTLTPELYKDLQDEVKELYTLQDEPLEPEDDNKPWYVLEPAEGPVQKGYPPYLNPEAYVFKSFHT